MTADRSLVHIAIHAAFIGALGLLPLVSIPVMGGVPITAQSLGVMLAGVMLGPVRGALAVLLFLFIVALGAPLLAGGRGGIVVFYGPSVGFLIGFPVAAFACGAMMRLLKARPVFSASLASAVVGGIVVLYAFGLPGLAIMLQKPVVEASLGGLAYLPGDILKAFAVAAIVSAVDRGRPDAILSRH